LASSSSRRSSIDSSTYSTWGRAAGAGTTNGFPSPLAGFSAFAARRRVIQVTVVFP
jgi:hypothetical protein